MWDDAGRYGGAWGLVTVTAELNIVFIGKARR
jgi:hypothetical protein